VVIQYQFQGYYDCIDVDLVNIAVPIKDYYGVADTTTVKTSRRIVSFQKIIMMIMAGGNLM
jgi:hypothetical protein